MLEGRTSNVEAGGIEMEAGRSTDDRISEGDELIGGEVPCTRAGKVWLTQCPGGSFPRKGKRVEAAAVRQMASCMVKV
jgi:hypothetical protein